MKITKKEKIIRSFEMAYNKTPLWEIGRPQHEFIKLEAAGEIHGRVLDVGCGTGENVIYLIQHGYEVVGVDIASAAIDKARRHTWLKGMRGLFLVHDALRLETLGIKFDTIIDSGLFHVFSDEARIKFVKSISSALRIGGTYFVLCFSDLEPTGWGPRRVTQDEIRKTFEEKFRINYIRKALFEINQPPKEAHAWLSSISGV